MRVPTLPARVLVPCGGRLLHKTKRKGDSGATLYWHKNLRKQDRGVCSNVPRSVTSLPLSKQERKQGKPCALPKNLAPPQYCLRDPSLAAERRANATGRSESIAAVNCVYACAPLKELDLNKISGVQGSLTCVCEGA